MTTTPLGPNRKNDKARVEGSDAARRNNKARAEATNLIVVEKSTGVPRREPSGGHNDRERRARSEVASSFSPNRRLAGNDARRRITQNHNVQEYGRDQDDLRNVIEDWRRFQDRTPSPPR
jgi:hypothetical protein